MQYWDSLQLVPKCRPSGSFTFAADFTFPPGHHLHLLCWKGCLLSALELCCFLFPALCNMLCKLCSSVPCTVGLSIGGSGEAKRENHRLSNTVSEEHRGISLGFNLQNSSVLASIFELHTGIGLSTCEALRQCHCAFQHCTL